jgi:hypothetical protein
MKANREFPRAGSVGTPTIAQRFLTLGKIAFVPSPEGTAECFSRERTQRTQKEEILCHLCVLLRSGYS